MNRKATQRIARALLIAFVYEIIGPLTAMALTGGPAQPEFSSFEPVTTTSMVNEFTGAFTYNLPVLSIPGPDGSGYALSLSYHSGESPEGEASWVGYGWTLNPGAINRNKRGFADDHKGASVKYWNRVPANWTVSIGGSTQFEAFGFNPITGTASASLRYNNYKGFGYTQGLSLSYRGMASLGYDVNDGKGSFSYSVNPGKILSSLGIMGTKLEQGATYRAGRGGFRSKDLAFKLKGLNASRSVSYTFGAEQQPTNVSSYTGTNVNFSLGPQICATFLPIGGEITLQGSYSLQQNVPLETQSTYGYMYSHAAGNDDMMDFYIEKDSPFDKRDRYIGMPFSNADNFMVTGEGVGGGFRLHNRRPGHFYPNKKESSTDIIQLGAEIHAGPLNFGVGADIGVGNHSLTIDRWGNDGGYTFAGAGGSEDFDEPYFFRFNNDLGGSVIQAADDKAVRADVATSGIYGFKSGTVNVGYSGVYQRTNNGKRSGRSSYIAYHTNHEMLEESARHFLDGEPPVNEYNSYCKDWETRFFVDRTAPEIEDGIGEFAITNENGSEYIYGLPVYSRNENSLQYGLQGLAPGNIYRNYLAYKSVDLPQKYDGVVVGEERSTPYASTYLLTQINSADYSDYTYNGPTDDDFGGYTKFEYERVAGTADKTDQSASWYRWRIPYNGLLYNRNSLSDPMDDMGSVMSGEKEIYYLKSIETKTHVALFITANRDDAREAHASEVTASSSGTAKGSTGEMKKLIRIELYAKDHDGNPGKLIQTVRFEYDYALCRMVPNGTNGGGKLTLRKVWFEYEGAVNVRVSPYVFGYEYKQATHFAQAIQSRYGAIVNYASPYFASGSPRQVTVPWTTDPQNPQNPDYYAQNIDRWGNYQFDGHDRHNRMNPWVDQTPDPEKFDPAAWQLKWIRLPSGGEIHVQYEQHDYRFVQDRPAMAMVTLKSVSSAPSGTYYLNVSELGLDDNMAGGNATNTELHEMKTMIQNRFVDGGERIYFRMLFPLVGSDANLENCVSEYITGYAKVSGVGVSADGLYVSLMDDNSPDYVSPADVCEELFKTSKSGNIRFGQSCDGSKEGIGHTGVEDVLMALLGKLGMNFLGDLSCQSEDINLGESYLRIPLTRAKKGGGIRVKRLLMYDAGIETADAVMYGTEYLYQTEDGKSSGVATNEPSTGREENPLITSMVKRTELEGLDGILSGDELDQFEGPLGESILPAPSIGYSRVVARSIHTGSTNTGFTISEFHTALDKPFDMTYDAPAVAGKGVEHTDLKQERDWIPTLPLGPVTFGKANVWMAQGYRFVLNSMHGQPMRISTYGGDYADATTWSVSSQQVYEYFAPGETVPMWDDKTFTTKNEYPGKEMEVVFATRKVEDVSSNVQLELDFSLGVIFPLVFFPPPFVTVAPSVEYSEKMLHIHTMTKVVRYPVIQKRVTSFQDGIYHVTENIAFDRLTGRPSITKTSDGYDKLKLQQSPAGHDGLYHTYQFPASHQYEEMSQKAVNERLIVKDGKEGVESATLYRDGDSYYISLSFKTAKAACDLMNRFTRGDLLKVQGAGNGPFRGLYHVHEVVGNRLKLLETSFSYGTQILTENIDFEIVRSGRTNQLAASAGSITTYGPQQAPTITPPQ